MSLIERVELFFFCLNISSVDDSFFSVDISVVDIFFFGRLLVDLLFLSDFVVFFSFCDISISFSFRHLF